MNVYFDQKNRSGEVRMRPLRRISVDETFVWKGFKWQIAGVYVCCQGIVLDVCKQVEPENIWTFLDKWEPLEFYRELTAQEENMREYESPLEGGIRLHAWINGKQIKSMQMYNACYIPPRDGAEDKKQKGASAFRPDYQEEELMEFYKLDRNFGWCFQRISLRWDYRRIPKKMVLKLSLMPVVYQIPCAAQIKTVTGNPLPDVEFSHPITGSGHHLYVDELKQEVAPDFHFDKNGEYLYPSHYQRIEYHFDLNTSVGEFRLKDSEEGSRPVRKTVNVLDKQGKKNGAVSILGGACGVAFICGLSGRDETGNGRHQNEVAVSRLKFEPVESTAWQIEAIIRCGEEKEIEICLQ